MGTFNKNKEVLSVLASVQDQLDVLDTEYNKRADKMASLGREQERNREAHANLTQGVRAMSLSLKTKEQENG